MSLYLHIPFCRRRCGYCDFNTHTGLEALIPRYMEALREEVRQVGRGREGSEAHTVYFGGGTPSLLEPDLVGQALGAIRTSFGLMPGAEITVEANPGTVDRTYLQALQRQGVNRLSLGAQSGVAAELQTLERGHTFADVVDSTAAARQAGFTNLNLDLIYGIPGQSLSSWEESLRLVLDLEPEHLSLYALALERGTPLRREVLRGTVPPPDDDLMADMYDLADEVLARAGYSQYEISNWARGDTPPGAGVPARACRHNLQYWRNLPYLGFGAGAHGYAAGRRYSNVLAPATYIERIRRARSGTFPRSAAAVRGELISADEEMRQTMWLGLRLTNEGIVEAVFRERLGLSPTERFPREIEDLTGLGLLEWREAPRRLVLTRRGRLLANQVFLRFV